MQPVVGKPDNPTRDHGYASAVSLRRAARYASNYSSIQSIAVPVENQDVQAIWRATGSRAYCITMEMKPSNGQ